MKKKIAIVMLSAALAASQGVTAMAARSSSSSSSVYTDSTSSSTNSEPTGFLASTGTLSDNGRSISIGDSKFHMVAGKKDSVARLPQSIVNSIDSINSGKELTQAGTGIDLTGYKALVQTTAMMLFEKGTKVEKKTPSEIPLYVPNLKSNLGTVQILFYNNFNGRWQLLTPTSIDYSKKQVKFNLPCSGTYTIVYKK